MYSFNKRRYFSYNKKLEQKKNFFNLKFMETKKFKY